MFGLAYSALRYGYNVEVVCNSNSIKAVFCCTVSLFRSFVCDLWMFFLTSGLRYTYKVVDNCMKLFATRITSVNQSSFLLHHELQSILMPLYGNNCLLLMVVYVKPFVFHTLPSRRTGPIHFPAGFHKSPLSQALV